MQEQNKTEGFWLSSNVLYSPYRTDQTAYGIFKNGVCVKTVPDLLDIPFDDFVTFYLGCSHSFELALTTAGLPVRHQQVNRAVPSYKTKIPCLPAGPFWANVVASMRPMPRDLVQRAVEATAVLEQVHGAPVHIGHPCWIGVQDLLHILNTMTNLIYRTETCACSGDVEQLLRKH